MYDAHVQAWTRDRVHVLELMDELQRLRTNRINREYRAKQKQSAETLEAIRKGIRHGDAAFVSVDGETPVEVGQVHKTVWVQKNI